MSQYARGTGVSAEKSRMEIERTLRRYGAVRFGVYNEPARALVHFGLKNGRDYQLPVTIPVAGEKIPGNNPRGMVWTTKGADQEGRRRWRVLLLNLKALLEAVETGLMSIDSAFLAYIVIPGTARTLGEAIVPRLAELQAGTWRPAALLGEGDE
jgi:hypothetical protein